MLDSIIQFDHQVLLWLNSFGFTWVDYLMAWPTYFGDALFLLPVVLVLMIIWDQRGKVGFHFAQVVIAVLSAGVVIRILKNLIQRPRPYAFFYDSIDKGEVIVHYLFRMDTSHSFPSGHAATVFAAAVALHWIYGSRLRWLYLVAVWIASTRVYVAAHFPSDVLVGGTLGAGVAWLVLRSFPWAFLEGKWGRKAL